MIDARSDETIGSSSTLTVAHMCSTDHATLLSQAGYSPSSDYFSTTADVMTG